jgi:AcrR family transcriptional regulator
MYCEIQVYSSRTEASRLGEQRSSPKTRVYNMRARQDSVEQTRLRITDATMRLHESVGPAATTVSAIADAAGVTRLTVYRHFPDDEALVTACSGHWRGLHPSPDAKDWAKVQDPVERLRTALAETYLWARAAAPMMTRIYQDLSTMPAFVSESLAQDEQARVATLSRGFHARGHSGRLLRAALRHALHIRTWESLCVEGGLDDHEATELMVGTILTAVRGNARSGGARAIVKRQD